MLVIQGSVRVRAEDIERVRSMAQWYAPAVRAYPGCLYYALTQDMLDPTLVHISERWVDETAYAASLGAPHGVRMAAFMRKVPLMEFRVKSYIATQENVLRDG